MNCENECGSRFAHKYDEVAEQEADESYQLPQGVAVTPLPPT